MATTKSRFGRRFDEECRREVVALASQPGDERGAGNCYDNDQMESFWATTKTELIDGQVYATRAEATSALFHDIEVG